MTKEKGMRYGCHEADDHELMRHRVKGEVEQVMAGKVLVDMDSIFDDGTFENACRPLVILVEGALGSGKTTLAYHYCHEWANGNLTMFDLVALVYLRHPAVHSASFDMTLIELLLVASDDERDLARKVAQLVKDGLKLLLILDGWDEAPAFLQAPPDLKHPPDNSFLGKLLRSVSAHTTILITSRPDSSVDLHKRPNVKRVEILGFTKESIHEYFREALSTQLSSDEVTVECSKLKEHFSKYSAIESSCYIPLNAAILTLVYLRNRTLPTTQYELLCELLLCCIDREVNTRQPNRVPESISSLDNLPRDLKDQLNNICKVAYEGIMQNKVVFTQKEISTLLLDGRKWIMRLIAPILPAVLLPTQQDIPTMGVLQKVQWAGIHSKIISYNFSHLSIQELLAAYFISKMKESEHVRVFRTLLYNPRFAAVLQFYAGFTKLTNQGVRKFISGIDLTHKFLLSCMRCFFEAQVMYDVLCQQIVARMNGELDLSHITLSPLDCMSVGYFLKFVLRHSELRVKLVSCSLNDNLLGLLMARELSNHPEAKAVLHGVTELNIGFNQFSRVDGIVTALQTNTTMKTLEISHCSISDEGTESLARALAVNRSLQEMDISGNKICDNGIAHIATTLQTNCTLKTIKVSVTDKGVESLAAALTLNYSLEILKLSWSSTHPDITMEKLGVCISTNSVLRELQLDIDDETQTEAGFRQLDDEAGFQQLVEVGGKKLIQSLENNRLRTLVLILDCSDVDDIRRALNAVAASVNSARNRKGLLDIDLKVVVESIFSSFNF